MNPVDTDCLDEIEKSIYQSLGLNPNNPESHNTLGIIQAKANLLDKAIISFCRAIQLKPDYAEAYNNLGLALKNTHGIAEAEACLRRAIELNPKYPDAHNNLGILLKETDRLAEGESCFRQALTGNPNYPEVYHNLGHLLKNSNRLAEAEEAYCKAIELAPDFLETRVSLGTLYLLQEHYAKGWENYEMRYKAGSHFQPTSPRWQGEDLSKRTILLYYDQGFGDTLQFVRFAMTVAAAAAKTIVWVQRPLAKLLATSQPQFTIHTGTTPPSEHYDFACPLLSLPLVLQPAPETLAQAVPYIQSTPKITATWRSRLAQHSGNDSLSKIGVVWAGNPNHDNDHHRSIPFDLFSKLFTIDNIHWISLQVDKKAANSIAMFDNVMDFSAELVDFSETAGIIENLDLVITVDSAVAHLAGSLGRQTWLLLPFAPDWRWGLAREDSLWYPTVHLFRQNKLNDWPGVLERVKIALTEKMNKR